MKIKEIMTKEVISVKPDESAMEGMELLFQRQISGLPVIDEQGMLVGMFTEKGIIAKILPTYMEKVGRFVYAENPKAVKQKIEDLNRLKVKEVMRKDVVTIDEDAALCEVARTMITQKARRLPVLNKAKEVIGIVARVDVLKALFAEYKG